MKMMSLVVLIALLIVSGCVNNTGNSFMADASESKVEFESSASMEVTENTEKTFPAESHISSVTEATEATINEKPQFEHNWQTLYYDVLLKYIDTLAMFNVIDLDGNGTPELLLSEGPAHAFEGILYTVSQDKLVCLGEFGAWGEFQYDFNRNYLYSTFFQMGSAYVDIFNYTNEEIAPVISFYSYDGSFPSTPSPEYTINEKEVSEDVFVAEFEKYYEDFDFNVFDDSLVRKYDVEQIAVVNNLNQYS